MKITEAVAVHAEASSMERDSLPPAIECNAEVLQHGDGSKA